jgi:hypothetical protein
MARSVSIFSAMKKIVCVFWLSLLVLLESFAAIHLGFDSNPDAPAWEHPLGWALLVLPCALLLGLVQLMRSNQKSVGFYLVAASLLLWTLFISVGFVKGHQIRRLPLCLTPMYCLVSFGCRMRRGVDS